MSLHKELTDFTIGSLTLRTPVTVQPGMPLSAAVRPVPECQLNFSFPESPRTMRVHTTLPRRSWPVCFGITPRPAKMEFAKRSAMPRYPSEALSKSVVYHETAGLASTPARSGGSLVPIRGSFARINAVELSLPAAPAESSNSEAYVASGWDSTVTLHSIFRPRRSSPMDSACPASLFESVHLCRRVVRAPSRGWLS